MPTYFEDICNHFLKTLNKLLCRKVIVVSNDRRNIHFIANNKKSRSFNIYRLCDIDDVNIVINEVYRDLA